MDDQPGVGDRRRKASPWPLFVALGLAISEVGVVLNLLPLSVGGLLLLVGSVSGIVREAGYVERPWGLLGALGALLVVLGAILVGTQVTALDAGAIAALVERSVVGPEPNGVVQRGLSVGFAGAIALIASRVAAVAEPEAGPV